MNTKSLLKNLILVAVVVLLPVVIKDGYYRHLLVISGIYVILATGLNLLVGYLGLLSLGHHAFYGIGAYTSALLFKHLGLSFWVGLPSAGLAAAMASFLLGYVILRVRGHRFVIITLAFAEIVRLVSYNWISLTDGQNGISGLPSPKIALGNLMTIDFFPKYTYYYLVVAIAAITIYVCKRLVDSRVGRSIVSIRENPNLAASVGVDAFKYSMIAFVVGAFFAGLAGSLYAHLIRFVSPDIFDFHEISAMLVMVIMGGKGTIVGPVIGAIIFTILPEYLRVLAEYRLVIFGLILVVAILYMPQGIVFPAYRGLGKVTRKLSTLRG